MGIKNRWLGVIFSIVVVLSAVCIGDYSQARAEEGRILTLPVPEQFQPARQADGSEKYVLEADIEREIRKYSPGLSKVFFNRRVKKFIVPEPQWVIQLLGTYDELLEALKVKGQSQTWDCENYSALLNSLTTVKIWQAGYWDTHAALGWLKVNAQKEWAGMPGELHALMFTVTSKGIYIIEPQNGQYTHISRYPNKSFIEEVYLF